MGSDQCQRLTQGFPLPCRLLFISDNQQRHVGNDVESKLDNFIQTKERIIGHNAQAPDGSWVPLWFGNEHAHGMANPVYGTAKVLSHLTRMKSAELLTMKESLKSGIKWLIEVQKENGTWGGDKNAPATVEETALALDAIAGFALQDGFFDDSTGTIKKSFLKGVEALVEMIEKHDILPASTIGLYFARLWYHEKLYPLIFSWLPFIWSGRYYGDKTKGDYYESIIN